MARLVGIDFRASHVRAVVLHTSYRRVAIERMLEVDVAAFGDLEQALAACALPLMQHSESVSVAMDGEQAFLHRLKLPGTAMKQLAEVIPFELEAQIPVDFDELVYDYRVLRRAGAGQPVVVLSAAARIEHVRARIEQVARVLGRPVERMAVGPLPLANLASVCPELAAQGPLALVDLGGKHTEIVVLAGGEPVFARTLSRGVAGLPESAPALASDLRQTAAAFAAQGGEPLSQIYLIGGGAAAPGAEAYLSHELGVPVGPLPRLGIEGVPPELADAMPRFAKAISIALGMSGRARDLDLRRGPLAFQRGYGFIKERVPLLTGLGVAILVSFAFAAWAELRTLGHDEEVLSRALATLSKDVLGQETTDPEEAKALLDKALGKDEVDPRPQVDAFDVMVEISKAVPSSVTHDIEELDVQRGHVKINGVVGSAEDAQTVASNLKNARCFNDVKISKVTQVINSDRQKYVLELEVKCPEDKRPKKKTEGGEASPE
ncbi:MAG: pilus assembly protein PilM [Polyangiaceae bacterium]|nr:pilus assembly protein PilM [Polyangiaceae bacterium]